MTQPEVRRKFFFCSHSLFRNERAPRTRITCAGLGNASRQAPGRMSHQTANACVSSFMTARSFRPERAGTWKA